MGFTIFFSVHNSIAIMRSKFRRALENVLSFLFSTTTAVDRFPSLGGKKKESLMKRNAATSAEAFAIGGGGAAVWPPRNDQVVVLDRAALFH